MRYHRAASKKLSYLVIRATNKLNHLVIRATTKFNHLIITVTGLTFRLRKIHFLKPAFICKESVPDLPIRIPQSEIRNRRRSEFHKRSCAQH